VGPVATDTTTIAFCDLVGSSRWLTLRQPAAVDRFKGVVEALERAITLGRGRIVKRLGDGLLCTFTSTVAGVETAAELMRLAGRLGRRHPDWPVELRVGVSVGEVRIDADDGDVLGTAVVEASRLCDLARPMEVLVTDRLVAVAGTAVHVPCGPLVTDRLRGMAEPTPYRMLRWREVGERVALPAVVARSEREPLVGRDDLRHQLTTDLASAQGRRSMLLAGEAGIGKTRLAASVAAGAAATVDGIVLYGSCHPELRAPYQPFVEAVGTHLADCDPSTVDHVAGRGAADLVRILPDLPLGRRPEPRPPEPDPDRDRLRLFEAVDAALGRLAELRPVLLVVDDLHWASPATLLLLRYLAGSARPGALGIVATYRDTEVGPGHPLRRALAELHRRPSVTAHRLEGLAAADIVELLPAGDPEDRRRLAERVRSETGGNPFFVHALTRSLRPGGGASTGPATMSEGSLELAVPDSVRDVVLDQLGHLTPAGGALVAAAAVVGDGFDLGLLAAVAAPEPPAAEPEDGLAELVRWGLVVEAGDGRYDFRHAMVRAAAYDDLEPAGRAQLHLRAAMAFERAGTGPSPATLLHHLLAAGSLAPTAMVADYGGAAARQALDQVAPTEAADLLEAALTRLEADPEHDPGRRSDLLLLQAEARARLGDRQGMRTAALAAAEAARDLGSAERLARAACWYGAHAVAGRRDETGVALCREALGLLDEGHHDQRALVEAVLATLWSFAGDDAAADAAGRRATDLAEASGSEEARARALYAHYHLLWGSERTEEQIALARALTSSPVVLASGLPASVDADRLMLYPTFALGRLEDFALHLEAVATAGEAHASAYLRGVVRLWQGARALLEGRFDDFDAGLDATAAAAQGDANLENAVSAQLFHRWFEKGALAEIVEEVASFQARSPGLVGLQAALALALIEAGRTDEAIAVFDDLAADDFGAIPHDVVRPAALAVLTEVAAALDDGPRATVLARLLEPYRGQLLVLSAAYCCGAADRFLGMAHHVARRSSEVERHYRAAVALEAATGARPHLARTRAWYARWLAEQVDGASRARGEALAAEAEAAGARLGLGRLARWREELRA